MKYKNYYLLLPLVASFSLIAMEKDEKQSNKRSALSLETIEEILFAPETPGAKKKKETESIEQKASTNNALVSFEGFPEDILKVIIRYLRFPLDNNYSQKYDINYRDKKGRTALHWAAFKNSVAVLEKLLKIPTIDVNAIAQDKSNALLMAIINENNQIVEKLLSHPAIDINYCFTEKNKCENWTPIMFAISRQNLKIVDQILSTGKVNLSLKDAKGVTPLMLAILIGNLPIVERIIQSLNHLEDINYGSGYVNPLVLAANAGRVDLVELLLQRGASSHRRDRHGVSLLQEVRLKKDLANKEKIVALLRAYGATE